MEGREKESIILHFKICGLTLKGKLCMESFIILDIFRKLTLDGTHSGTPVSVT